MSYDSLTNIDVIYLTTETSSQNSLGEWTKSYTTSTTETKCRLSPLTTAERKDTTGLYDDVSYLCFCKIGSTINKGMKVSDGTYDYRVKSVITDSNAHHKTALLVQI